MRREWGPGQIPGCLAVAFKAAAWVGGGRRGSVMEGTPPMTPAAGTTPSSPSCPSLSVHPYLGCDPHPTFLLTWFLQSFVAVT